MTIKVTTYFLFENYSIMYYSIMAKYVLFYTFYY
jgi:hypothetical protein